MRIRIGMGKFANYSRIAAAHLFFILLPPSTYAAQFTVGGSNGCSALADYVLVAIDGKINTSDQATLVKVFEILKHHFAERSPGELLAVIEAALGPKAPIIYEVNFNVSSEETAFQMMTYFQNHGLGKEAYALVNFLSKGPKELTEASLAITEAMALSIAERKERDDLVQEITRGMFSKNHGLQVKTYEFIKIRVGLTLQVRAALLQKAYGEEAAKEILSNVRADIDSSYFAFTLVDYFNRTGMDIAPLLSAMP